MSNIILYYTITSPPSRGIILASIALGVELQLKNVDMSKGEHLTPEFLKVKLKFSHQTYNKFVK